MRRERAHGSPSPSPASRRADARRAAEPKILAKCTAVLQQRTTVYAAQAEERKAQVAALAAAVVHGGEVQYRALKAAAVRAGAELNSPKVSRGLAEGEIFTATEQRQVSGRWRVRMARGWVSLTAASGRPLCVTEAAVQLFLQSVPVLQTMSEEAKATLAGCLEAAEAGRGEAIVTQGEQGDAMYFVEEGEAEAEIEGVGVVMAYKRGAGPSRAQRDATRIAPQSGMALRPWLRFRRLLRGARAHHGRAARGHRARDQ